MRTPSTLEALRAAVCETRPLHVIGRGTKVHHGPGAAAATVSLRNLNRITAYEPGDLVVSVEAGARLLPIEVKATAQPSSGDLASMRGFMEEYGDQVTGGLLLYGGQDTFWIAKNVLATPWWSVV